jgi:hypothetical protein
MLGPLSRSEKKMRGVCADRPSERTKKQECGEKFHAGVLDHGERENPPGAAELLRLHVLADLVQAIVHGGSNRWIIQGLMQGWQHKFQIELMVKNREIAQTRRGCPPDFCVRMRQ